MAFLDWLKKICITIKIVPIRGRYEVKKKYI